MGNQVKKKINKIGDREVFCEGPTGAGKGGGRLGTAGIMGTNGQAGKLRGLNKFAGGGEELGRVGVLQQTMIKKMREQM